MGERVFQIGQIDTNSSLLTSIIKILDHGFKFIPCVHLNVFHIFQHILNNIDKEIFNFNRQFIRRDRFANNNSTSNTISTLPTPVYSHKNNYNSLCESLECFLKTHRNNKYVDSFLSKESIIFKLEILSQLGKLEYNNNYNLSRSEIKDMKVFLKDKPFKVVELDKNIGAGIISI